MKLSKDELGALLDAIAEGDAKAFERIVDVFYPVVLNIGWRMTGNREDAVDIAQDSFVKVYRKIEKYDRKRPFVNWLYRISINCSIDHIRRKGRMKTVELIDNGANLAFETEIEPGDFERAELTGVLKSLSDNLSPVQKAVFVLRVVEGFGIEEVARTLKIENSTVRCHLHLARKRIKELIEEHYPEYVIV